MSIGRGWEQWPASERYAATRSLTDALAKSSLTQAPTSSNARIRPRSDGMYAVKWRISSVTTPNIETLSCGRPSRSIGWWSGVMLTLPTTAAP